MYFYRYCIVMDVFWGAIIKTNTGYCTYLLQSFQLFFHLIDEFCVIFQKRIPLNPEVEKIQFVIRALSKLERQSHFNLIGASPAGCRGRNEGNRGKIKKKRNLHT